MEYRKEKDALIELSIIKRALCLNLDTKSIKAIVDSYYNGRIMYDVRTAPGISKHSGSKIKKCLNSLSIEIPCVDYKTYILLKNSIYPRFNKIDFIPELMCAIAYINKDNHISNILVTRLIKVCEAQHINSWDDFIKLNPDEISKSGTKIHTFINEVQNVYVRFEGLS